MKKLVSIFLLIFLLDGNLLAVTTTDDINAATTKIMPQVIKWRRFIHEHPELSNREFNTSKLVADLSYRLRPLHRDVFVGGGIPAQRVSEPAGFFEDLVMQITGAVIVGCAALHASGSGDSEDQEIASGEHRVSAYSACHAFATCRRPARRSPPPRLPRGISWLGTPPPRSRS